jgi:hypothetical protein
METAHFFLRNLVCFKTMPGDWLRAFQPETQPLAFKMKLALSRSPAWSLRWQAQDIISTACHFLPPSPAVEAGRK